jgi:peptidoglycan/xylan/chitin deacetylase (PgdA/CDA1 family)
MRNYRLIENSMWKEKHPERKARWPAGVRLPIMVSVHHQSEEAPCPLPDGQPDPFDFSERQYGGRRGAWRLLEVLAKHEIKATWFICGATARRYPQISRAAKAAGHCIAGHGYHHEFMCNLPPQAELQVIKKTVAAFQDVIGEQLKGWRTCFPSHNTLDILLEHFHFDWDCSRRNDDKPYIIQGHGRDIVEIPFIYDADSSLSVRITSPQPPNSSNTWDCNPPEFTLRAMKAWFDALYESGSERPLMLPLTVHDFITGRPSRAKALDDFLSYAQQFPGAIFTTHDELASWWRSNYEGHELDEGAK